MILNNKMGMLAKKGLWLLLVASTLGLASSCTLTVLPETAQTYTNSFKTENDFQSTIYSILGELNRNYISENPQIKMGLVTDAYQLVYAPSALQNNFSWKSDYNVIYLCNEINENMDRSNGVLSKEKQDYYSGQAYFFKGLSYFNLARRYGDAIITTGTQQTSAYGRRPAVEVLDEAIADASKAYDLLPEYGSAKDATGSVVMKCYGNKGACAALLANLYAWKASMANLYHWTAVDQADAYNQAITWCTKVISNPVYSFESSRLDFIKNELNSKPDRSIATESIFEFQQYFNGVRADLMTTPADGAVSWPVRSDLTSGAVNQGARIMFKLNQTTVDAMYAKADGTFDQRHDAYFWWGDATNPFPSDMTSGGYAYTSKWSSAFFRIMGTRTAFSAVDANAIYWRLSAIYLLRAECYEATGAASLAQADLNTVRAQCSADLYPAANDPSDLKRAIFNEETKDLIWEGERYYNVVRNHYYLTDLDQHTPQATSEIYFDHLSDQDVQEGALYLPIGTNAFINNDLMRQNVYWLRQGVK